MDRLLGMPAKRRVLGEGPWGRGRLLGELVAWGVRLGPTLVHGS